MANHVIKKWRSPDVIDFVVVTLLVILIFVAIVSAGFVLALYFQRSKGFG